MAIASMQKVMIVAHRSQASELLGVLQGAGIVEILDAERAMVSKEWPELMVEKERHREIDESIDRLGKGINFVKPYSCRDGTSLFAPLVEVDAQVYRRIVGQKESLALLSEAEAIGGQMEKLAAEAGSQKALLSKLLPWQSLSMPIEELSGLSSSTVFVGSILELQVQDVVEALTALGAAYEKVAGFERREACIVVALNETAAEAQKILRSADFEAAVFEGLTGTVREAIARIEARLDEIGKQQSKLAQQAAEVAKNKLTLQVLYDDYKNMQGRVHTASAAPATDHVVFFEGWVKQHDYNKLEKLVARFDACTVSPVTPGEGEEPPVEIDNAAAVRPFETITRLYGTPGVTDVDPTVFLAPFFALFFGLCLTDAGYGLVVAGLLAWVIGKFQGDKKALWMLLVCSLMAVLAGAITGSWFGDTIQTLLPQGDGRIGTTLDLWRKKIMLFDPMQEPLIFIGISLALGYIQILFGLGIAFVNLLRQKNYAAAVFEKLTWLILLNCILLYALAKNNMLPPVVGSVSGWLAIVQFALIFWFTERHSGLAGRIGGGVFAVFSTVFYMGDMLSYVRLMALGMVSAGLGMAINILAKLLMEVPYIGYVLGLLMFVGGHTVNILLSLLSSFVHSLRLQFVEFFPKFFSGGGREFRPLRNDYQHIMVVQNETKKK